MGELYNKNDIDQNDIFYNEISVDELITFLVDEVYSNFPELISFFGTDDEIRKILHENIKNIKRVKKNVEFGSLSYYDLINCEITIYSEENLTLESLRNNNALKSNLVHESIHALFSKTKNINDARTGCFISDNKTKREIKGAFAGSLDLSGEKNIFKKFAYKKKYLKTIECNQIGRALNEGVTEWITEKCLGDNYESKSYTIEKTFIRTITELKGNKAALILANGDYNQIADMLNMNHNNFIMFMRALDLAKNFFECIDKNFQDKDYQDNYIMAHFGQLHYFFNFAQEIFVESFVIPELSKIFNNGGANVEKFMLLDKISSRYEALKKSLTLDRYIKNMEYKVPDSKAYRSLKIFRMKKLVDFSQDHRFDVDDFSNIDSLKLRMMYDKDFCDARSIGLLDSNFYKKITDKANEYILNDMKKKYGSKPIKQKIAEGSSSLKDIAGLILLSEQITKSDVRENRAARRAKNKMKKKGKSH